MNIAILIYHDVLDFEISSAMTIFKTSTRFTQTPLEIYTIHRTRASIQSSSGLVMTPNYGFSAAPEPDVLIIPGGNGIEKLFKDSITKEYIRTFTATNKHLILGSNAGLLLGEYNLLEQKTITTYPSLLETIWKYNPAEVLEQNHVTDHNLRSISRSAYMLEVCLEVVELEFGIAKEVKTHLGL